MNLDKFARLINLQKDRRVHPRIYDRPLRLLVSETEYVTENWSMTGAQLPNFTGTLETGTKLKGRQLDTHMTDPTFVAEIVWQSPDNSVGLRFLELDGVKVA
jgi:hypothetical protein